MRIGALKLKAQIYCGDAPAMGPGKADLLEAIDREGSISAAGRAMAMSYRRTWMPVDGMNRCWIERLVRRADGSAASGAKRTEMGRAPLDGYRTLETRLAEAVGEPTAGRGAATERLAGGGDWVGRGTS